MPSATAPKAMAPEVGSCEEVAFKVGNRAQEEVKMTLVLTDAIKHFREAKVTHSAILDALAS